MSLVTSQSAPGTPLAIHQFDEEKFHAPPLIGNSYSRFGNVVILFVNLERMIVSSVRQVDFSETQHNGCGISIFLLKF